MRRKKVFCLLLHIHHISSAFVIVLKIGSGCFIAEKRASRSIVYKSFNRIRWTAASLGTFSMFYQLYQRNKKKFLSRLTFDCKSQRLISVLLLSVKRKIEINDPVVQISPKTVSLRYSFWIFFKLFFCLSSLSCLFRRATFR